MAADRCRIPAVIRENVLESVGGDSPPVLLDQLPDAVKAGTGIRERAVFESSKLWGQIMVGMQALIPVLVLKDGDAFGPHLYIRDIALTVAQHHIRSRARSMRPQYLYALPYCPLFKHDAFQRIMRQSRTPAKVVQRVGKMRDAELVHS